MVNDVIRVDSDVMNRLREHIAFETHGRMYGQIGKTIEYVIEEHLSRSEIGINGEKKAIEFLKNLNFEIIDTNENKCSCPYDVLAKKENKIYAINVKSANSKKGLFGIQVSNVSRLLKVCKYKTAIMGFLLVSDNDYLMLLQDSEHSNWVKPINSKRIHDDLRHYTDPNRQRELTRLRVQKHRAKKKEQEKKESEKNEFENW